MWLFGGPRFPAFDLTPNLNLTLKKVVLYVVHSKHVTKMSNGPDSLPANRVSSMISPTPRGVGAPNLNLNLVSLLRTD